LEDQEVTRIIKEWRTVVDTSEEEIAGRFAFLRTDDDMWHAKNASFKVIFMVAEYLLKNSPSINFWGERKA